MLAVLGVQLPFDMVQVYTYVPDTDTVAVDDPELALLKVLVPGPEVCVQSPVPTPGVLPPSVLLVSPQTLCKVPAVAVVGVL